MGLQEAQLVRLLAFSVHEAQKERLPRTSRDSLSFEKVCYD
jgi:hypothetical protein